MTDSAGHSCPYRFFSKENLPTALLSAYSSQGLSSNDLPEIMELVKKSHFHVACTRVFEITHSRFGIRNGEGVGGNESVTHPNQYAAKSIELEKAQKVPVTSTMEVK
jgi:DNA primase large subunit